MTTTNCIICGGNSGSAEHVFPASLGGRRTNRKIYCTSDNNKFGRHVSVLEGQLSLFNAMLGVRPDRRDSPKPVVLSDDQGKNYEMVGNSIELGAPPSLNSLGVKHGDKITLGFKDIAQYQQWVAREQKDGWAPQMAGRGTPQRVHFSEPLGEEIQFGGPEGLQAIGYVAITYLAQYFPEQARQDSLLPFKQFLACDFSTIEDKSKWPENASRVWWDAREAQAVAGTNPYEFGHSIVVGVSPVDGIAYAYVSLFSALNFGVELGPVNGIVQGMVTVYVDPLANSARGGQDITVECSETFTLKVMQDDKALSHIIDSGLGEQTIQGLLQRIEQRNEHKLLQHIEEDITSLMPGTEDQKAMELVEQYSQRVYNLLHHTIETLSAHLVSTAKLTKQNIDSVFESMTRPDTQMPNGLSREANTSLTATKVFIATEVSEALKSPDTNKAQNILSLLNGASGREVICRQVLQPILESVFKK